MNNFMNGIDKKINIYRIFKIERLMEVFESNKLCLVNPLKWDDPFDNFLFSCKIKMNGELVGLEGIFDKFYGQCWTTKKESDAMWRIYSTEKTGVKVKTTVERLFDAVYDNENEFADRHYYIGRVNYQEESEIVEFFRRINGLDFVRDITFKCQTSSLFLKRMEFEHEEEVRLIYRDPDKVNSVVCFDINPHELFDEIVFDPRMDEKSFSEYKSKLERLGFKNDIYQSSLYKLPNLILNSE